MTKAEKKDQLIIAIALIVSIILSLVWMFWPTKPSVEDLEVHVKTELQTRLNENLVYYLDYFDLDETDTPIIVDDIQLMQTDKNKYRGFADFNIAVIRFRRSVNVVSDGQSYLWELE